MVCRFSTLLVDTARSGRVLGERDPADGYASISDAALVVTAIDVVARL
jgi:hypothetical protein